MKSLATLCSEAHAIDSEHIAIEKVCEMEGIVTKEPEPKAEIEVKAVVIDGEDEYDDVITEEWEEAIRKVMTYRRQLATLTDEKETMSIQRAALSKHVFDLQNEIRLLEAKILLAFEHVVKVNYSATQMIMIAEGQLHSVD